MKMRRNLLITIAALPLAYAQTPKALTARELFYIAPSVAKPAAANTQTAPKPARAKPAPGKPVTEAAPPRLTGGGQLTSVTNTQPTAALGLRYSLLKYVGETDYIEVDSEVTFRSGEKIRLRLQANDDAYLYLIMQGSSGTWRVMFPAEEFEEGSNRVLAGRIYDIPGRTRLVFDEQAGVERLFVILSRQPEAQMDKLIYDLENRKGPEKKVGEHRLLMASTAIGNSVVDQLRGGIGARDLVFEKVDDRKPAPPAAGGRKETAVYVVNASTTADARLVADIQLRHK